MKKIVTILLIAAACLSLKAEFFEFFGAGNFNQRSEYGSGNNAFSADSNSLVTWNAEQGFMHFALKEGRSAGMVWARMFNSAKEFNGLTMTVKLRLRGKGRVGFAFTEKRSEKVIDLTPGWKKYTFTLTPPLGTRMMFFIRFSKGTEFDMDDLSVGVFNNGLCIVPPTGAIVVKPGSRVPEQTFKVYPNDIKGTFRICNSENGKEQKSTMDSEGGKAVFPAFTAGNTGYHRISFATTGEAGSRDIIIAPPAVVDSIETVAKSVKLNGKPLRILYLGDSLTDYNRGHNHASITAGMLDKYNPGMVYFRNSAIGGDQVRRIDMRLSDLNVYYGCRYHALWDEKYDIIFISLGHNDTVAFKETNFSKPQIPITEVNTRMRSIISKIRKNSDARIVLISGVSMPKSNNPHYHFGIPELVEAYNSTMQKIAADLNVEYLDLYTPFKAIPEEEKIKLFLADRVHLSLPGHIFAAGEFLKFLAR